MYYLSAGNPKAGNNNNCESADMLQPKAGTVGTFSLKQKPAGCVNCVGTYCTRGSPFPMKTALHYVFLIRYR